MEPDPEEEPEEPEPAPPVPSSPLQENGDREDPIVEIEDELEVLSDIALESVTKMRRLIHSEEMAAVLSRTDRFIRGVDAIDLRDKIPTRDAPQYQVRSEREMGAVRFIVIHYTGLESMFGRPTAETVARIHAEDPGLIYPSTPYHIYIEDNGQIKVFHSIEVLTWHAGTGSPFVKQQVGGNNWESIGVAFTGDHPNRAQLASLERVVYELTGLLSEIPDTEEYGGRWNRRAQDDQSAEGWPAEDCLPRQGMRSPGLPISRG